MYAFNDPLPYAYVLILVKLTNLIPIYILIFTIVIRSNLKKVIFKCKWCV